jgi:hypothetical protein
MVCGAMGGRVVMLLVEGQPTPPCSLASLKTVEIIYIRMLPISPESRTSI